MRGRAAPQRVSKCGAGQGVRLSCARGGARRRQSAPTLSRRALTLRAGSLANAHPPPGATAGAAGGRRGSRARAVRLVGDAPCAKLCARGADPAALLLGFGRRAHHRTQRGRRGLAHGPQRLLRSVTGRVEGALRQRLPAARPPGRRRHAGKQPPEPPPGGGTGQRRLGGRRRRHAGQGPRPVRLLLGLFVDRRTGERGSRGHGWAAAQAVRAAARRLHGGLWRGRLQRRLHGAGL